MKPQEYKRQVFIKMQMLADESSTAEQDFNEDSFEGEMKRAALDGILQTIIPKEIHILMDAMRVSGITPSQSARAITYYNLKTGYKNAA